MVTELLLAGSVFIAPVVIPTHEPVSAPATASGSDTTGLWDALAECESNGEWDYGPHSGWGSGIFEGGLQFHPSTWDAYRPEHFPASASDATREQEIEVATDVLADQGWGAWPACSRKLGLR